MAKFLTRPDGVELVEWKTHDGTTVDHVERVKKQHPEIWNTLEAEYTAYKTVSPDWGKLPFGEPTPEPPPEVPADEEKPSFLSQIFNKE